MNRRVSNKNADLLKKISLMGTEDLCQISFQGLGENTSSLQPALKNTAPGL